MNSEEQSRGDCGCRGTKRWERHGEPGERVQPTWAVQGRVMGRGWAGVHSVSSTHNHLVRSGRFIDRDSQRLAETGKALVPEVSKAPSP